MPFIIIRSEMWQDATFDLETIKREAILAKSLGFNVFRVYLHDLLWTRNCRDSFIININAFLEVVDSLDIKVIFVLFDDCHRTKPKLGTQQLPVKCVHNSGWVQSPGIFLSEKFKHCF